MIRFIDLGKQIGPGEGVDEDWPREFTFFDTITDTFISLEGEQVFASWAEFTESYDGTNFAQDLPKLERFKRLCPQWVFETNARSSLAATEV